MSQRIIFEQPGHADVMRLVDQPLAPPSAGEIRIRHTAIGVNFIDIYHRSGFYPLPLPSGLGLEAVGVVEAVGDGVTGFSVGQRVAYASPPAGAYATARNFPANLAVHVPPNISDEAVASGLLKGLTAWYLLRQCHRVLPQQNVLIWAAAGGTGQLLARWARHLGANVFGVVGSEEKKDIALWAGCEDVFLQGDDIAALCQARGGMHVVYDSVGKESFQASLNVLRPRGMFVSFGSASGAVPPIDAGELARRGSLIFTRPRLWDYLGTHAEIAEAWGELSQLMIDGVIKSAPSQEFALGDVAQAHEALESRKTTGAMILRP